MYTWWLHVEVVAHLLPHLQLAQAPLAHLPLVGVAQPLLALQIPLEHVARTQPSVQTVGVVSKQPWRWRAVEVGREGSGVAFTKSCFCCNEENQVLI